MKPLIDTQEFLALSSFLNYQLEGDPVSWRGILNLMLGQNYELDPLSEDFLVEALDYLGEAYGRQKRRLGPLAILHPIRASALLVKAAGRPSTLDLLCALLHDKGEDLTPEKYSPETWNRLDARYRRLLEKIDARANWFLNERIAFLAKPKGEQYTGYLGRLLGKAREAPELVAVKLADRLDNTFDLRVDLQDSTDRSRCFQLIFDILFVNSYRGQGLSEPHPVAGRINGAMRLYQLYKNAVLLSMLRAEAIPLTVAARKLFYSLAVASIREAQTILLHIFSYHIKNPDEQRAILFEVMDYSHDGGYECIREEGPHVLDGLFRRYFVHTGPEEKQQRLSALYGDKRLMALVALSFLIVFAGFMRSDDYVIRGISAAGIIAQP
ncbi:MAG: HD domain-containing protein [Thermodesulfobacteriota bacterium]